MYTNVELVIIQARAAHESAEYAYRSYRIRRDADPAKTKVLSQLVDRTLGAMSLAYDLRAHFPPEPK